MQTSQHIRRRAAPPRYPMSQVRHLTTSTLRNQGKPPKKNTLLIIIIALKVPLFDQQHARTSILPSAAETATLFLISSLVIVFAYCLIPLVMPFSVSLVVVSLSLPQIGFLFWRCRKFLGDETMIWCIWRISTFAAVFSNRFLFPRSNIKGIANCWIVRRGHHSLEHRVAFWVLCWFSDVWSQNIWLRVLDALAGSDQL